MNDQNLLSPDSTCFIAEGTVINGEFRTTANVRVDGVIRGNVHCDGRVIMGKKGSIKGDITTSSTAIEGNFEGNIVVKENLHLLSTANVLGTFKAGTAIVDEGAILNGECHFGNNTPNK